MGQPRRYNWQNAQDAFVAAELVVWVAGIPILSGQKGHWPECWKSQSKGTQCSSADESAHPNPQPSPAVSTTGDSIPSMFQVSALPRLLHSTWYLAGHLQVSYLAGGPGSGCQWQAHAFSCTCGIMTSVITECGDPYKSPSACAQATWR